VKKTLVAALAVVTTVLAPHPAEAKQAPVLTVTAAPDASYPQEVTLNGDAEDIVFQVSTTEATTVTATAVATGLTVTGAGVAQAVTSSGSIRLGVTATTPGMHSLAVTFSAPGAMPVQVTLPYVFAAGSPVPVGTGSLAGRSYGWMGYETIMESSSRTAEMMTFVNATYAYLGLPPAGQPKCKSAGKGCVPYAYDAATGVVQVGGYIVGKVAGQGLATDGWVVPYSDTGEQFRAYTATDPLTVAPKDTRLAGVWHFRAKYYPAGIWAQSVTFRKNGTYELYYQVGAKDERHSFSGSYAVTKPGKVVFKARGRVVQVGTLALAGSKVGKPKPAKLGLWLVLSGPKGKHGDGNLLAPVKGK
jgi:hypothetical protein